MMKMAMVPQKTQLSSIWKFNTPGATTFTKRDLALMFGYTTFQVFVVGAAGGRSGDTALSGDFRAGSGGGGGSSKLISGSLLDLSTSESVVVGAKGTTGSTGNPSGAGGRGGNSSFGSLVTGYGGYGGHSAHWTSVANTGGAGANPNGTLGPEGGGEGDHYPAMGAWNETTLEGAGGGGGAGSGLLDGPQSGEMGAFDDYVAAGEAPWPLGGGNDRGGGGGGANVGPFIGVATEKYGTGWYSGTADGVVIVKLS